MAKKSRAQKTARAAAKKEQLGRARGGGGGGRRGARVEAGGGGGGDGGARGAHAPRPRWQDASERELWYEGGPKYWEQQTVGDNNGVLGGFADVHVQDTRDSLNLRESFRRPRGEADADGGGGGGDRPTRALDVAAGIGRVSGATLLTLCDRVDVQDAAGPSSTKRAATSRGGPRVERFMRRRAGIPPRGGRYDLVWIQGACCSPTTTSPSSSRIRACSPTAA